MKKIQNKIPIIIDTDPGHDDALAIMLLVKSGNFDIKAVTTVAGNSTIQNVTNNARYILDLVECPAPIYSGSAKPMDSELVQAVVHGENGLEGAKITKKEPLTGDAVEKIIELVRSDPGNLSVVVIGPQTNIARAFVQDPELPNLIKQLIIMGGAISVPGNKNRVAEFNIFVDPEAADIVSKAPVKKVLIPLDVCNDIVLQMNDFDLLKNTKLYKPLSAMLDVYKNYLMLGEKVDGMLMYDVLAAYYIINPDVYSFEPMDIVVETNGELTRGMTVAEKRTWGEKRYNYEVVTKIDKKRFVDDFIRILSK